MIVDMSELDGKSYTCLEGCAMCCLCQPELTKEEVKMFETDLYLSGGLTDEHIDGRKSPIPNAVKLQGGCGACHFLKNRLCTIHEIKPHFCRQFPVHVHLLRRVQLSANLSCRGVSEGGSTLKNYAKTVLAGIPDEELESDLAAVRKVVGEFDQMCHEAGVHQPPEKMRSVATKLLPMIAKDGGVGRLLAFADGEPSVGGMPEADIVKAVRAKEPEEELDQIARESNYEQFEIGDVAKLPVYVDERFGWNLIQSRNGKVNWIALEEDGSLRVQKSFDPEDISLLTVEREGLAAFADYARVLISRDAFLGSVYNVCNQHRYQHDLMTVYLGVLGTSMLDLWWRASLLGKVLKMPKIDRWLALEGVRAFDMDSLDAPTIGAFV
jgi:Fe-S-cluster containining protein